MQSDKEMIAEWQNTHSPQLFSNLMIRYRPVVNSVVNKFKTVGVAPATLRAQATVQLIKAMETYDVDKGTVPTTHIWNSLQKVQRLASESLMSGRIPENRAMARSTYTVTRDNLSDRLGREPSASEMSDELKWDIREIGRMEKELGDETTASHAEFDFYGSSTTKQHGDRALVDYLYYELSGSDKVIFEHTFGFGGKSILNNKEIAQKLGVTEMSIHRAKKRLSDKVRSYR